MHRASCQNYRMELLIVAPATSRPQTMGGLMRITLLLRSRWLTRRDAARNTSNLLNLRSCWILLTSPHKRAMPRAWNFRSGLAPVSPIIEERPFSRWRESASIRSQSESIFAPLPRRRRRRLVAAAVGLSFSRLAELFRMYPRRRDPTTRSNDARADQTELRIRVRNICLLRDGNNFLALGVAPQPEPVVNFVSTRHRLSLLL